MIGLSYYLLLLVTLVVIVILGIRRSVPGLQIFGFCVLLTAFVVSTPLALEWMTNGRAALYETMPWVALAGAAAAIVWLAWRSRPDARRPGVGTRPPKSASPPPRQKSTGKPASPTTSAHPTPPAAQPSRAKPASQASPAADTQREPMTVFISYRRDDSADVTGRIYDRLSTEFGREHVYKDVDTIPLGVDFREHINKLVADCDVVLAVIGRQWLTIADADDRRRLEDERDPVRLEIVAALNRDIPVVPILVGGSTVPPADALPDDISDLAYRNGGTVRPDPDFHKDVDRLIAGLRG